jgi:hypothetical protein
MSEAPIPASLRELLDSSLREGAELLLHCRHTDLRGVVVRLDDDAVELRVSGGRCVVRLDSIDAVLKE